MKTLLIISVAWLSAFLPLPTTAPLDDQRFDNALVEEENRVDTLPRVLNAGHADLIATNLRHQAVLKFATHQLPAHPEKWKKECARAQ